MRSQYRKAIRNTSVAILAVGGLAMVAWRSGGQQQTMVATATESDRVKRGEYLVTIGGCNDCHTPWKMGEKGPEPDMTRKLSGHPAELAMPAARPGPEPWAVSWAATNTAFAGPWGVSFTANL